MSSRTGFLVRDLMFGKRRSLASGAHWARDDKYLNHQNFPDTVLEVVAGCSLAVVLHPSIAGERKATLACKIRIVKGKQ